MTLKRKNNHTTISTTKKNDCENSKDISGSFSGVVGSVGSLPRLFPLFHFFCLLVSSVSDFCPDTGGVVVDTFFLSLTCSVALWGGKDAANKQHCRVHTGSQPRWACPCSWHANHSSSTMLSREPSEAGPRLRAPPPSKPLRFGAQVALRGADSVGTAFCALPGSE